MSENPFGKDQVNVDLFKQAHMSNDVDFERDSYHHTLGKGATQAAPGDHNHDDRYTNKLGDFTGVDIGGDQPGVTATALMSRRGDMVEFWVQVTTDVAQGANVVLVAIPTAHRPIMAQNKYIDGLDAATGGVVPCYIDPTGVKTVFGRAAGSTFYATWTYVAVAL